MSTKKINVAIVGLGFGAEFIPIYQKHPNANLIAISQRNERVAYRIGTTHSHAHCRIEVFTMMLRLNFK